MRQKRSSVAACLDEIESAQAKLNEGPPDNLPDGGRALRSWIRRQKGVLKSLNYKGRMPHTSGRPVKRRRKPRKRASDD